MFWKGMLGLAAGLLIAASSSTADAHPPIGVRVGVGAARVAVRSAHVAVRAPVVASRVTYRAATTPLYHHHAPYHHHAGYSVGYSSYPSYGYSYGYSPYYRPTVVYRPVVYGYPY